MRLLAFECTVTRAGGRGYEIYGAFRALQLGRRAQNQRFLKDLPFSFLFLIILPFHFVCHLVDTMTTIKDDDMHLEKAPDATPGASLNSLGESLDDDPVYTRAEQRKIIHRVDRRLITVAGIIYMNSLMDRSNLPNAMIAGMAVDLGLINNNRYVSIKHL
jgi:hypothetical protein